MAAKSNVLPFRRRLAVAISGSPLGQIVLQPRLAMTAAMAFFSIALTMNLTGVRLQDLRVSELRTGSLKRNFYQANARAAQYYAGLRVVYELESRVRDLQGMTEDEAPAGVQSAPNTLQPDRQGPGARPGIRPGAKQPAPNSGTSRREEIGERRQLVASHGGSRSDGKFNHTQLMAISQRCIADPKDKYRDSDFARMTASDGTTYLEGALA
jgi:hypothetical protein